ncbi:hypothetical protein ACJMK2_016780 [Sinanodonta woodiana]|uniref:ABC transporter domain-containing protein n=1 Tax=Sinanodonta woodiana TaxID=1069815 RepID=A0ABD3UUS8_SINWO
MASLGRQFVLLLWKNFVLQKRKVCVTVFEIIIPIAFALLLVVIRSLSSSEYVYQNTYYEPFYPASYNLMTLKPRLLYTPNTTVINTIMTRLATNLQGIKTVTGFNTEKELETEYSVSNNIWAGVVFTGDYSSSLATSISYSLRVSVRPGKEDSDQWQTSSTYSLFQSTGPRNNETTGGEPYYYETGFLSLKCLLDKAIVEYVTGKTLNTTVAMQRMPYPPHLSDVLISVLQTNLPLFIVLSFILNALQISKNIAYEKENKLKESMKMMGLSTVMYWLSWFVKCLIYLAIAMIFYTMLLCIPIGSKGKVLNYTEPTLFYVFLFVYALSIIAFCFMVSTFFKKANSAAFAAGILFFLTYFPFFFLNDYYGDMSQAQKLAVCLLSNIALAFGCNTIAIYEGTGEGAQWSNFFWPGSVDDNFTLLDAIGMLLVDTVLYMLVAWYVDNVHPGEYGVSQPFYFPFMPSYWCGRKIKDMDYENTTKSGQSSEFFERDPPGLTPGISIRHLKKEFGSGRGAKVAVADMTLNMFEGQIMSLLGHNGAGKTTTMSMLTGFLAPTSGTAIINGYDIRTDIAKVRQTLGLCPQHNILFDLLTVKEHLEFFAQMKGCEKKNLKAEVDEMIKVLGLEAKRNALSSTLSGGQKRKLSVGIALIAGSKIVILDEPTSGMDPAARRQTWEILQKFRSGRTMILTTHFMDEADILGDRIAIMANGVVKCAGKSMFLKKIYGAGYHMVMVKNKTCNVDRVTAVVNNYVPTATLASEISAEVSYILPFDQSSKFEALFQEIESKMAELGITSFGTSATTMEEVFLKVGEEADDEENGVLNGPLLKKVTFDNPNFERIEGGTSVFKVALENEKTSPSSLKGSPTGKVSPLYGHATNAVVGMEKGLDTIARDDDNTVHYIDYRPPLPPIGKQDFNAGISSDKGASLSGNKSDVKMQNNRLEYLNYNKNIRKNTGVTLILQQFKGMLIKKMIHTWRNRIVTIVQLFLPIIFTILALLIEETAPTTGDEPALVMDLSSFGGSYIPYYSDSGATAATFNYTGRISGQTLEPFSNTSYATMDDFLLNRATNKGTSTFNKKYIVAGSFDYSSTVLTAKAHFNGQPFHGPGISLTYMMNGLMGYYNSSYTISTTNHPLPKKVTDNTQQLSNSATVTGFNVAISILFGMAFMAASFIIFLIKERSNGAKHLQVVSGVGSAAFWISTFLWDMINYIIPVFAILIVFAAFQTEAYTQDGHLGYVFLIFLMYGWSILPFVYMFNFLFKTPAAGMVAVSMINIITGLGALLATSTLSSPQLGTESVGNSLEWAFAIFLPNFNLGQALMDIYTNYAYETVCESYNYQTVCSDPRVSSPCCFPDRCGSTCFTFYSNYLTWDSPGIGRYLVFMAMEGFVYFGIIFLIESGLLSRLKYMILKPSTTAVGSMVSMHNLREEEEDSDVIAERNRINNTSLDQLMQSDEIIIRNVTKYYGPLRAVNNISIGVPAGECFGLLGQNGAGKTTTFKMLTGDESITSGQAYLSSFSVKSDIKMVQQNLGYCPQFDALIDQMTGRETLWMYARLRGVEESKIGIVVNDLIKVMMLDKHADKQTGFYSGGNKRKLSTAIALIGDPHFIFLDEPTTGMDPGARRQLWNVLSQVRASGRTLVLTSHSMEECDALCTQLVIMVNGDFKCFGSPQRLKNKFGHGYTLLCRMGLDKDGNTSSVGPLCEFIKSTFPLSQIFDDKQGYVHFQIPDQNAKLAQIFGRMEEAKVHFNVADYSVHQTSLEQIFLTFTQNQVPPKEEKKKYCSGLCCCK